jgi:hypothetical protein
MGPLEIIWLWRIHKILGATVFEEYRGRGYGPSLLEHIKGAYTKKNGIIVEVEKPEEASTQEEKEVRQKRILFYEKAGFTQIPGIRYAIWDVPMHLMVCPATPEKDICAEIGRIMYDIYHHLMGPIYIHKMKIETLK